ncbi:MAG: hypothetical protein IJV62_04950 [Eggerthellaceae bacterium]|nr:hypothetical protein [Eggerthellaceae bacterium]
MVLKRISFMFVMAALLASMAVATGCGNNGAQQDAHETQDVAEQAGQTEQATIQESAADWKSLDEILETYTGKMSEKTTEIIADIEQQMADGATSEDLYMENGLKLADIQHEAQAEFAAYVYSHELSTDEIAEYNEKLRLAYNDELKRILEVTEK